MLISESLRATLGTLLLAGMTFPAVASEADWRFVTGAEAGAGRYNVQVDVASLRKEKAVVRYWVQFVDVAPIEAAKTWNEIERAATRPARGPSLYESNCATGQSRILQGNIILGYDGPLRPLTRPADWEYAAPDSVLALVNAFVCGEPTKLSDVEPWPGERQK